jgi:pyruvate/2-oxoglutarate/acetoin dehydrogenase E1 component
VPELASGVPAQSDGRATTFLEAIREGIREEMERDERVLLLGEDIGVYGGAFKVTEGMLERFGAARVIDTPVSETGFTGAAAGAAHMGLRPVVEMQFIDFVASAYDMITNYIATSRYRGTGALPLVIRGPSGGGVRGGPFHSQNPEMAFFHTPGLKIVYPSTPYDAKGLIKAAIRDEDPVLFFEHKALYRRPQLRERLPEEEYVVPLGEARVHREGRDLTIVTYAAMVHKCAEAAEVVEREDGLSVEIIDLRTLLPLDEERIVDSVRRTNRLLVVHEDTRTGGIAGEIAMRVNEKAFAWLDAPILRVTAIDAPVPYSPPLEDYFLPQVSDVISAIRYLAAY